MKRKIKQLKKILESFESFALIEPFVSPEVAINSIFQDIVDALGMHAWGKKIYRKDMYGGDGEDGEMSGEIMIGWNEGYPDERSIGVMLRVSLSPHNVAFNIYRIDDDNMQKRIIVSRDGGDYISLINNVTQYIRELISDQLGSGEMDAVDRGIDDEGYIW